MGSISTDFGALKSKNVIAVCSRHRSHWLRDMVKTFRYLTFAPYPVYLVVRDEEVKAYEPYAANIGARIYNVNDRCKLPDKRQLFMNYCHENGVKNIFFLDDDLDIYPRNDEFSSKYALGTVNPQDVFNLLCDQIFALTSENYPMVGVLFKQGSQGASKPIYWNKKIMQLWSIHIPTLVKEQINISGSPYGDIEDFYTQLSLRSRGYILPTLASFAASDGGQAPGGCQDYRKAETHKKACFELMKMFPESVKLVEVPANGSREYDWTDVKIDFNAYFKKEFHDAATQDALTFMLEEGYLSKLMPWRFGHGPSSNH